MEKLNKLRDYITLMNSSSLFNPPSFLKGIENNKEKLSSLQEEINQNREEYRSRLSDYISRAKKAKTLVTANKYLSLAENIRKKVIPLNRKLKKIDSILTILDQAGEKVYEKEKIKEEIKKKKRFFIDEKLEERVLKKSKAKVKSKLKTLYLYEDEKYLKTEFDPFLQNFVKHSVASSTLKKSKAYPEKNYRIKIGITVEDDSVKKNVNKEDKTLELQREFFRKNDKGVSALVKVLNKNAEKKIKPFKKGGFDFYKVMQEIDNQKRNKSIKKFLNEYNRIEKKYVKENMVKVKRTDGVVYVSSSSTVTANDAIIDMEKSLQAFKAKYILAGHEINIKFIQFQEILTE